MVFSHGCDANCFACHQLDARLHFIRFEWLLKACMCEYVYTTLNHSHLCCWCMCLSNRQRDAGVLAVCVWVCLSSSGSEIMNVVTQTSQQCIAVGSGSSQGYPTVMNHSLKWERDRRKREKSEESNNCNIPYPESLRNTQFTLQAVCVWTYGRVCTNSTL